jgi:hypothetical protein
MTVIDLGLPHALTTETYDIVLSAARRQKRRFDYWYVLTASLEDFDTVAQLTLIV